MCAMAFVCVYGTVKRLASETTDQCLQLLEGDFLVAEIADAHELLRRAPPFGAVHARTITVHNTAASEDDMVVFAAVAAAHTSLTGISLINAPLATVHALDALVDAVLALPRLSSVMLLACVMPAAGGLERLLGCSTLQDLSLSHMQHGMSFELLADALRTSSRCLTSLTLRSMGLFHEPVAGIAVLGALTAHPTLRKLDISFNTVLGTPGQKAATYTAVAALVGADIVLQELQVSSCALDDAGLVFLMAQLPRNRHLRVLTCRNNRMSDTFARNYLLPAVHANTGLHELHCADTGNNAATQPAAAEAEELVQRRLQRS